MFVRYLAIIIGLPLACLAFPAHAYIGPGAGAGAIAVVFGILGSIVMAFVAILWYPIKRMIRKIKAAKKSVNERESEAQDDSNNS